MRRNLLVFALAMFILLSHCSIAGKTSVRYGDTIQTDPSALEVEALTALSELVPGYGGEPMVADANLIVAARDLARLIGQSQNTPVDFVDSDLLARTLRDRGIYDNRKFSTTNWVMNEKDVRAFVEYNIAGKPLARDYTHMGAGVVKGNTGSKVLVVILVERRLDIEPFPQTVSESSTVKLRGRAMARGLGKKAKLLVTPPSGEVIKLTVSQNNDSIQANVPFTRGPGTYLIQVVLAGDGRSMVGALMEVQFTGQSKGPKGVYHIEPRDYADQTTEQAEMAMLQMINEARKNEGLAPLRENYCLTEMARAHSRDMMFNDFMGHYSPTRGDINSRRDEAGLGSYRVLENVALNADIVDAMNGLLQSPSHRKFILDKRVTRVGVGISKDEKSGSQLYYITQEFADIKD